MPYNHGMLDLETRGNSPGCHVLSIGLIMFDPFAKSIETVFADNGFYTVISKDSCDEAMLHVDEGTMDWWGRQSAEAREVLFDSQDDSKSIPLPQAIVDMVGYVGGHVTPRNALIWGNGADFDNPIIGVAARMVFSLLPWHVPGKLDQSPLPWQWGNRCYRTIKNIHELVGGSKMPPITRAHGTHHNALDDAKNQALHLWDMASTLRDRMA